MLPRVDLSIQFSTCMLGDTSASHVFHFLDALGMDQEPIRLPCASLATHLAGTRLIGIRRWVVVVERWRCRIPMEIVG